MKFNDVANCQGIVQDVYFEASTNAVAFPIKDVTRAANNCLDTVLSLILSADGRWQFDDKNAVDLPIGSTAIVSGQQDYSFSSKYLVIKAIEISDINGNWKKLIPIDNSDLGKTEAMSQFANVPGNPVYYDKMGDSILLYPIPNYALAGGLRAYFQRNMDYFDITDTDKEPGFAQHLHKYVSLYIQWVYCCAKGILGKANQLRLRMRYYDGDLDIGGTDKGEIRKFYSYREVDQRPMIKNRVYVKK